MSQCVLLNADYTFLNLVHWKRAMCLIAKGKVEVIKHSRTVVHNAGGNAFRVPTVMRLIKLIRIIYRTGVAFTKRNLLVRDGFQCAYCGKRSERLSIDHIIPRWRGGKTDFDNCVAACQRCNLKKGGRTPREAGMFLKKRPFQPTVSEFLRLKFKHLGLHHVLAEVGLG